MIQLMFTKLPLHAMVLATPGSAFVACIRVDVNFLHKWQQRWLSLEMHCPRHVDHTNVVTIAS